MAYVNNATILSALTAYVDQLSAKEILINSIFQCKTIQKVTLQPGIKYSQAINLLTSQPVWTLAQCGLLSGTGSVTLSQQFIQVTDIMQTEDICYVGNNTLSQMYTGMEMKGGINQEELTPKKFAKAYIGDKLLQTQKFIEQLIWQGNVSGTGTFSTTQGMNLVNGFLYQFQYGTGTSSIVNGNGTYSGALTVANAVSVINGMVNVLPQDIADKELVLFMSLTNFNTMIQAITLLNGGAGNYWFTGADKAFPSFEIKWPFLNSITIIATAGLSGRNDLVLTYPENLYVGTDLQSDWEDSKIWYSNDLNVIRYRLMLRIGTQFAFPQYIVLYRG